MWAQPRRARSNMRFFAYLCVTTYDSSACEELYDELWSSKHASQLFYKLHQCIIKALKSNLKSSSAMSNRMWIWWRCEMCPPLTTSSTEDHLKNKINALKQRTRTNVSMQHSESVPLASLPVCLLWFTPRTRARKSRTKKIRTRTRTREPWRPKT